MQEKIKRINKINNSLIDELLFVLENNKTNRMAKYDTNLFEKTNDEFAYILASLNCIKYIIDNE